MKAQNNWSTDPGTCRSCQGSGKTAAAREAERLLALTGEERQEAFRGMEMEARSRLLDADPAVYEQLAEAELPAAQKGSW